jgi:hypothetical protein
VAARDAGWVGRWARSTRDGPTWAVEAMATVADRK